MTAYLILAFKNPAQLSRLVRRIAAGNSMVYIHIDKKVDITPFLFIGKFSNVRFVERRFRIVWGGYSITKCLISGMKEIMKSKYDHVVLMSGQDYPIKPVSELEQFLSEHKGLSFMSVEEKSARSKWWSVAKGRYEHYYFSDHSFKGKRFIHKVLRRLLPKRDFIYPYYRLFGGPGSTFCILSKEAADYIVHFMEGNSKGVNYARSTFASDEFWFQTILMNASLKQKIINLPLWYMEWDGSSKHPRVLGITDFLSMVKSDMYFARKFDMYYDEIILDKIDQYCSKKEIVHYKELELSR